MASYTIRAQVLLTVVLVGFLLAPLAPRRTLVGTAASAGPMSITDLALLSMTPSPPSVAPVFRPILPQLAQASIPVYLPSWLPQFTERLYPAAEMRSTSYAVYLLTQPGQIIHVNWRFQLFGRKGIVKSFRGPGSRQIGLGALGGIAYLDLNKKSNFGPTISWYHGGNSYVVFTPTGTTEFKPGQGYPVSTLIHIARSMVRVH